MRWHRWWIELLSNKCLRKPLHHFQQPVVVTLVLGATLRSASGADSSRGFQCQVNAPHLGRGASPRNYLKKILSFGQNQGIAWSSDSNLWGNQLLKEILSFGQNQGIAWSSDLNLWGNQLLKENSKFWTEPRYCMVLRLKPMGKPTI